MSTRRIYFVLAILVAAGILGNIGMRAQAESDEGQDKRQILQGSFVETVHVNETGRTFKALFTFAPGGGLVVTNFTRTGALSILQGAWLRTGDGEFALTFEALGTNGNPATGTVETSSWVASKVREKLTLNDSGDGFTTVFEINLFRPDGTLRAVVHGTGVGTRVNPEPLAVAGAVEEAQEPDPE